MRHETNIALFIAANVAIVFTPCRAFLLVPRVAHAPSSSRARLVDQNNQFGVGPFPPFTLELSVGFDDDGSVGGDSTDDHKDDTTTTERRAEMADNDEVNSQSTTFPSSSSFDPLITRLLLNDEDNDEYDYDSSVLRAASKGLSVWRTALLKGRLPTVSEFDTTTTAEATTTAWPEEPLFSQTQETMTELQIPRFVIRHPDTINSVLRTILRMATQFARQCQGKQLEREAHNNIMEEDYDDDYYDYDWDILEDRWTDYQEENDEETEEKEEDDEVEEVSLSEEEKQQLAIEIVAEGITQQWGGVIGGVSALDQLFGIDHGLLDVQQQEGNTAGSSLGFGIEDGIWKHSGWKVLPSLQREISAMPELRALIQELGKRPTAERSDSIHKFIPRRYDTQGALGAQHDPTKRTSIKGITLSGSLSDMLPSEAMLLVDRRTQQRQRREDDLQNKDDDQNNNKNDNDEKVHSTALRRLFLAKMAESKLLSYEASGWEDIPSSNIPNARYLTRLPSAPGGPIMVCLDTSWSMTGRREQLSKAVVLACVTAAHKQKRDIQVVAFSSARNTMDTGPITADPDGIQRLLEFLSSSFGGGTDVTGALKHAMTTVSSSSSSSSSRENSDSTSMEEHDNVSSIHLTNINSMASADILLVTDGEIPDPPVSNDIMDALDRLKERAGVQVHGLLVGKRESIPLAKLCTRIHDFLIGYESTLPIAGGKVSPPTHSSSMVLQSTKEAKVTGWRKQPRKWGWNVDNSMQRKGLSSLRARFSDFDDDEDDWGGSGKRRKRGGRKKNRYDSYDEDDDSYGLDEGYNSNSKAATKTKEPTFSTQAQEVTESLRVAVVESLKDQQWTAALLDKEKEGEGSCWRYRSELQKAVERVAEGLVEREEEARLVVLGMVSEEHVLFLGPPGTAKSVLGRRLSQLCGGTFFQRLLTRFTTPEEIFGPLSLKALENDEYRRKTDGFLPTATVAFLDEIFKANSAILNTLLTILNERQFDNGAGVREDCPIRCVVGASNEMPESDELDALYDRFLLRKEVLPVSDEGILKLLGMPLPGSSACDDDTSQNKAECDTVFTDDLDDLIRATSRAADSVVMDESACALMKDLRTFMKEDLDVEVSDRRLVKATRILKVSAASMGRTKVDPLDFFLLQHIVWHSPEQRAAVREWLWNNVTPGSSGLSSTTLEDESLESAAASSVRQFRVLLDGLRQDAIAAVRKTSGDISGAAGGRQADIEVIMSLSVESASLADVLQQRCSDLRRHLELLRANDHLWLDPDEAQAAQQLLVSRAEAFLKAANGALEDAKALERALSEQEELSDEIRLSVIELLWDDDIGTDISFSNEALSMAMKEAKAKYDTETFRKWKRARKKAQG